VGADLVDETGVGLGDDGGKVEGNILRVHVQNKLEGNLMLPAGGDGGVDLDGGQVAEDGGILRSALRHRLSGSKGAADENNINWRILMIGNLNQGLGDAAVDELDTEDVSFGEDGLDVGLEVGLLCSMGDIGLGVDVDIDLRKGGRGQCQFNAIAMMSGN